MLRVPDNVHKLALGLPRESADGVTMPSVTLWRRERGPALAEPAVGGTELALGASLKSKSEGQEVLLLAAGEDGSLEPVWQFWMLPGVAPGAGGGLPGANDTSKSAAAAVKEAKQAPPLVVAHHGDDNSAGGSRRGSGAGSVSPKVAFATPGKTAGGGARRRSSGGLVRTGSGSQGSVRVRSRQGSNMVVADVGADMDVDGVMQELINSASPTAGSKPASRRSSAASAARRASAGGQRDSEGAVTVSQVNGDVGAV